MRPIKKMLTVLNTVCGTGQKVEADLRGGAVVIVPTYKVLTITELKRCDSKTLDLLCGGHYVVLVGRTSQASLERALKKAFKASKVNNTRDLEKWGVNDREFL